MYRDITKKLKKRKEGVDKKQLILSEARQIGKTYSLLEFGYTEYDNVAYCDFENSVELSDVFEKT